MPSRLPYVQVRLTPDQHKAVNELVKRLGEASAAELGRRLFAEACKRAGIEWPEEMIEWGGERTPHSTKIE